jgi:site-specific recombinase XerD
MTYQSKKSKVLTVDNVTTFPNKAPDDTFLLIKVVLIFGLNGACRRVELCSLTVHYVEDTGNILAVTLHDTKTKKKRVLIVGSECNGMKFAISIYD